MKLKSTLKQAKCPLEKWWEMDKEKVINIIVETIETNLRKDAPKELSGSDLERFIEFGRPALIDTATEIADKILAL